MTDKNIKNKEKSKKEDKKKKEKKPDLKKMLEEMENKYKRALADYQNLLKQSAKEKEEFIKYANEQLILDIIPVFDNLKTSLSHIDKKAEESGWAEGIKYVIKQFEDVLTNLGLEQIKTEGEKFDPHTMEALDGDGEKVLKELKPGYKLNGKVIVAARVELEKDKKDKNKDKNKNN